MWQWSLISWKSEKYLAPLFVSSEKDYLLGKRKSLFWIKEDFSKKLFFNDFYFFHYSWFTVFCRFSTVQQSDLVTHTYIHYFSHIIFHHASDLIPHCEEDAGEAWLAYQQGCLYQETLQKHYPCYMYSITFTLHQKKKNPLRYILITPFDKWGNWNKRGIKQLYKGHQEKVVDQGFKAKLLHYKICALRHPAKQRS